MLPRFFSHDPVARPASFDQAIVTSDAFILSTASSH